MQDHDRAVAAYCDTIMRSAKLTGERKVWEEALAAEKARPYDAEFPYCCAVQENISIDEVQNWCRETLLDPHVACPNFWFQYPDHLTGGDILMIYPFIHIYRRVWMSSKRDVFEFKLRWHGPQ